MTTAPREPTLTEAYDAKVLQLAMLQGKLAEMQKALFLLAAHTADDKDKIRVPKQKIAADVVDVTWKALKSGSVVFTVVRESDGNDR